jgi:hypothetical protein
MNFAAEIYSKNELQLSTLHATRNAVPSII